MEHEAESRVDREGAAEETPPDPYDVAEVDLGNNLEKFWYISRLEGNDFNEVSASMPLKSSGSGQERGRIHLSVGEGGKRAQIQIAAAPELLDVPLDLVSEHTAWKRLETVYGKVFGRDA